MLRNKKKGFTLIELVIVIAIIGILVAIAVPRFADATRGANNRKIESQARSIAGAVNAVIADTSRAPIQHAPAAAYQGRNVVEQAGIVADERVAYTVGVSAQGRVVVFYTATGAAQNAQIQYQGGNAFTGTTIGADGALTEGTATDPNAPAAIGTTLAFIF